MMYIQEDTSCNTYTVAVARQMEKQKAKVENI